MVYLTLNDSLRVLTYSRPITAAVCLQFSIHLTMMHCLYALQQQLAQQVDRLLSAVLSATSHV